MNKEGTNCVEHSGCPDQEKDHQKLRDAIWQVYSEELKAAQDKDIIFPSGSSRDLSSGGLAVNTQIDPSKIVIEASDQAADNHLEKQELIRSESNIMNEMEQSINRRSISPELNELLEYVIDFEQKRRIQKNSQPAVNIQATNYEQIYDKSARLLNPQTQDNKDESNDTLDVNQNMNYNQNYNTTSTHPQQTDEDSDTIRMDPKRLRLPGIEQVINKTSFANQRSDYYNRSIAAPSYGSEMTQLGDQRLPGAQMSPMSNTSSREGDCCSYNSPLAERSAISRRPSEPGTFNTPVSHESQNSPLMNPYAPRTNSWSYQNANQSTPTLTSPQAQYQKCSVPGRKDMHESAGKPSPPVNNISMSLNNNEYLKYKNHCASSLPVTSGTASPQMENIFPPNAMVTPSTSSCSPYCSRSTLVNNNDYQKNLHQPPYSSPPLITSKLNQAPMHLANAQKLAMGSVASPTFSPDQCFPPHCAANSPGVKISPTTPPVNTVPNINTVPSDYSQQRANYIRKQGLQCSPINTPTTSYQEYVQNSAKQMIQNSAGINQQYQEYRPRNPALRAQQTGKQVNNKSQWSESYGNFAAHYKGLQGVPAPITSSRAQEFCSLRTIPDQQYHSTPRAQPCQHTCNQQFNPLQSRDLSSTSNQEFSMPLGQFLQSRTENPSFPQRVLAPTTSASAIDLPGPSNGLKTIDLTRTNPFELQDGPQTNNYLQPSPPKVPRRRRCAKGLSLAQIKRLQKKRETVEEKLLAFIGLEQCNAQTSTIITKHLYHIQSCPNWFNTEECLLCNQICEMVTHSSECQDLVCPYLYCGLNALVSVAASFSDPKFVYHFLKDLNVSEDEMREVYVLKNWLARTIQDL